MSVLAIIQARLGSTRLPYKALADIGGKPLVAHVVDRVRQVRGVDTVVLAVPPKDASTFKMLGLGVPVLAPDVETSRVLDRFAAVVAMYQGADTIMRVCADCPLFDPRQAERVLDAYRTVPGCHYAWNVAEGYTDGEDVEVFSRTALLNAFWRADRPDQREHVTVWIREHYDAATVLPDGERYRRKTSVDSEEDLQWVRSVIGSLSS